jgi:hypothetical protein
MSVSGNQAGPVGPVLEAIASALARLDPPDLSSLPTDEVEQARAMLFGPEGLRPEYLDDLRRRVTVDSGGAVSLVDADPSQFAYLSKEWGARYLRLTGSDGDKLLILGNTSPPVQFVPAKQ